MWDSQSQHGFPREAESMDSSGIFERISIIR